LSGYSSSNILCHGRYRFVNLTLPELWAHNRSSGFDYRFFLRKNLSLIEIET